MHGTAKSVGVHIGDAHYISAASKADADVVLQGGPFAATGTRIELDYLNTGQPTPKWRHYSIPDIDMAAQ